MTDSSSNVTIYLMYLWAEQTKVNDKGNNRTNNRCIDILGGGHEHWIKTDQDAIHDVVT